MRTIVQGHLIERPMVGSPWGGPSGMDLFQVLLMRQMCDILGVARQSRCKDPRWWGQEVASVVERKWREELERGLDCSVGKGACLQMCRPEFKSLDPK